MESNIIQKLWDIKDFKPNPEQEKAILYDEDKPLFITAAPGSGKTRVLLWRTVNLIVNKGVSPDQIFLSTFTDKAALQLKEGLKELLSIATNLTNEKYDLARMYLGTIHSNCHRIILDRSFSDAGGRQANVHVLDELGQYLFVHNRWVWGPMLQSAGYEDDQDTNREINAYLGRPQEKNSGSRHNAALNAIRLFNRLSEELADSDKLESDNQTLDRLYKMYAYYKAELEQGPVKQTDFSLLQATALRRIQNNSSSKIFEHVIIDEYQDTNTVQEQLVFSLAQHSKNLCVVGDDDQALYRFRGATVENFVDFPDRCHKYYALKPENRKLDTNYRSLSQIINVSQAFIQMTDWSEGQKEYRIAKNVEADRTGQAPSVFMTDDASPIEVARQIAKFVRELKEKDKISDYNQVAVLFSYLKGNTHVGRLSDAFEDEGIPVYAPRASCFLELEESLVVFGLLAQILGHPPIQGHGRALEAYIAWVEQCVDVASGLIKNDSALKQFVKDRQDEIKQCEEDYSKLINYCEQESLDLNDAMTTTHLMRMAEVFGLSQGVVKKLSSSRMLSMIEQGNSNVRVVYVLNRVTSLDWGLLDLFYRLTAFDYFRDAIDKAARGEDEGPMYNLALITQHLSRFQEERGRPILTAKDFHDNRIQRHFFGSHLLALHRLGQTEFEDKEDPFPKGRVSFITIHQAKGLEFPVVIMGGLYRQNRGPDAIEIIVRNELQCEGEPLDRIVDFDNTRLFYVALSRAKNILLLPRLSGRGQRMMPAFREILDAGVTHIRNIEWDKLEDANENDRDELGHPYSYSSDYMMYKRCPRQYMIFRKYGFIPARTSVMFFGSLVHQTIEDLHNLLLAQREKG